MLKCLPRGVTGFDAPETRVPLKLFSTACYAAARRVAGKVLAVRPAYQDVACNFHEARFLFEHDAVSVRALCNAHFPIVAFAEPPLDECDLRLQFIDCPSLGEVFLEEFSVLSKAEACACVTPESVAELGDAEQREFSYWKPQRLGEIIFNCWD
jgi:hypothetical protein